MGGINSKMTTSGTLMGAYPPPIEEVPPPPAPKSKMYRVRIPEGYGPGNSFTVKIDGEVRKIVVPPRSSMSAQDLKERKFNVSIADDGRALDEIYASTLPYLPGMEIVQSKPIVWGSVSHSFGASGYDSQSMGRLVSQLMQDAQKEILRATAKQNCNAVLGMTFNITNDSSGERGNYKSIIVTVCGTPCFVMKKSDLPGVQTDAVVVPLNNVVFDNQSNSGEC